MNKQIKGVLTAVVTTFDEHGQYCEARMRKQIRRQIESGNSIFCNGTNGEFFVLDRNEKLRVTTTCVDEVAGRVPVVAHIGEISTAATIELGRAVAALGVDAVSAITPYFVPLRQEELIAHYTAIADALTVPLYLYNIPGRTGNTLAPATAARLGAHPNIAGIKDSAGSYESLKGFLDAAREVPDFDVLCGPDHLAHQGFLEGCPACISGLANVAPEGVAQIWKRFAAGNIEASRQAQDAISVLRKELYAVGFAPAAVKAAAAQLGQDVGASRYPVSFSAEETARILDIVTRLVRPAGR